MRNPDYKSHTFSDFFRQPPNLAALPHPPLSITRPLPPYPPAPSHLSFFTSPHPLRPPSSRCTACLLSLEELKVALIWSPGFLQTVTEGASASEQSILGMETLLMLQEESDLPNIETKHADEVMLAIVASGHLGHKADFPLSHVLYWIKEL